MKLPDLATPSQPTPKRAKPGRTRRLPDDQVQQLIEGYQSGATVYELGDQSDSAVVIPEEMIHYGTSKTALLAASRGFAKAAAGTGVTVNSVIAG